MNIKKIQDISGSLKEKKVILRVGFDVSVEKGHAKEKFKIISIKKTLDYLMEKGAKVALMTWLGRPNGKIDPDHSLGLIKEDIENILGYKVRFVADCIGAEVKTTMETLKNNEVALLENVRFHLEEGDEKGVGFDAEFARALTEGFDILVNDAFSQSHRNQASIAGMPKYIPSYAGLQLQKEIEELDKVKDAFSRPALAIIGGAKIETKLPVIKFFERAYDSVLVGGKIANEAIDQNIDFGEKVIFPVDYVDDRLDIGPKTIEKFQEIIVNAKTIVWNGPVGKFEEERYARGTQAVFEAIMKSQAFVLVGGGETLEVLEKNKALDKISFVSTGGGAMLEYLGGKKLPGIEALKY